MQPRNKKAAIYWTESWSPRRPPLRFSRQALTLPLRREEARAVGGSPALWQTLLLFLTTWAVAGVVSTVGVIGVIGLMVPHMALAIGKKRSSGFLPLCFLIGAILTVLSDLLARTLVAGAELPVSIFSGGLAVVWLAWLFCTGKVTEEG